MGIFFIGMSFILRIKLLYAIMDKPIPTKSSLKKTAKKIKAFMVLIKQKLARQQVCRSLRFRRLMAMVFDPDETQELGNKCI